MKLRKLCGAAWKRLRWVFWRAAVVREATQDFSGVCSPEIARRDAEEWVDVEEKALRWWFNDGATPAEAFAAVTEEGNDGS